MRLLAGCAMHRRSKISKFLSDMNFQDFLGFPAPNQTSTPLSAQQPIPSGLFSRLLDTSKKLKKALRSETDALERTGNSGASTIARSRRAPEDNPSRISIHSSTPLPSRVANTLRDDDPCMQSGPALDAAFLLEVRRAMQDSTQSQAAPYQSTIFQGINIAGLASSMFDMLMPALTPKLREAVYTQITVNGLGARHLSNVAGIRRAVGAMPTCISLHALSRALYNRFQLSKSLEDLDEAIRREQAALAMADHPARHHALHYLAEVILERFLSDGNPADLDLGVSTLKDAVACAEGDKRNRSTILLSFILGYRYHLTQDIPDSDRDGAIVYLREGRHLFLAAHGQSGTDLIHIALVAYLLKRYSDMQKQADLDESSALLDELLHASHLDHTSKDRALQFLASFYEHKINGPGLRLSNTDSTAMRWSPRSSKGALGSTTNTLVMNSWYAARLLYDRLCGEELDLEAMNDAIFAWQQAVDACPSGHPERLYNLDTLAKILITRHEGTGEYQDGIECAVGYRQEILDSWSSNDTKSSDIDETERLGAQMKLFEVLRMRFQFTGDISDFNAAHNPLDEALQQDCIIEHPIIHREMLSQMAYCWVCHYQRYHIYQSLEHAALFSKQMLSWCPHSQTAEYSKRLHSLVAILNMQFNECGELEKLDECISLLQSQLACSNPSGKNYQDALETLCIILSKRFAHAGAVADLDQCITFRRKILDMAKVHKEYRMKSLADDLVTRFKWRTRLVDYLHGVDERTLRHVPIMARQKSSDDSAEHIDSDLQEAVSLYRKIHGIAVSSGVQLTQHHSLGDLAKALLLLFMQTSDISMLDEAIGHWRTIFESASFQRAEGIATLAALQSELLSEMSTGLRFRSYVMGDSKDLEHALFAARQASARLPESGGPKWALASALIARYRTPSGSPKDFEEAMLILAVWCRGLAKSVRLRQRSELPLLYQWARVAHEEQDASATEAYEAALAVTERSLIVPATLEAQHDALLQLTLPLALHAASHAISQGRLEDAVTVLERGRSMLWSAARQLRMPLDMAGYIDPDLRTQFIQTSREIELLSTAFDEKPSTPAQTPLTSIFVEPRKFEDDLGQKLARKRELVSRLEDLTTKIRALRGFDDFLQPPEYSHLQSAAQEGPVLIINHSKYRSDCIILLHNLPPTCVSLSNDFYTAATELAEDLTRARLEFTKSGKNLDLYNRTLRRVLQELWGLWAQPIVSTLEDLGVKEGSRVWLVPTSVLSTLPLHAAGPAPSKGSRKKHFQDYFICSYLPSISALIRARSEQPPDAAPPSMLVVGNTGGNLEEVDAEVDVLRDLGYFKTDCLVGDQAQLAEVKTRLLENSWVHLVCHGVLEPGAPFKSAFVLSGSDRLTLLDVIKSRIPNAEFAFLSACHTAGQTKDSAVDEVLHLAAAMQFSGFRSVVGTMWQMRDNDGPKMARDFYQDMFSNAKAEMYPAEVGYKKAARALNAATKKMRKRQVALEQWVNFIHIGA